MEVNKKIDVEDEEDEEYLEDEENLEDEEENQKSKSLFEKIIKPKIKRELDSKILKYGEILLNKINKYNQFLNYVGNYLLIEENIGKYCEQIFYKINNTIDLKSIENDVRKFTFITIQEEFLKMMNNFYLSLGKENTESNYKMTSKLPNATIEKIKKIITKYKLFLTKIGEQLRSEKFTTEYCNKLYCKMNNNNIITTYNTEDNFNDFIRIQFRTAFNEFTNFLYLKLKEIFEQIKDGSNKKNSKKKKSKKTKSKKKKSNKKKSNKKKNVI